MDFEVLERVPEPLEYCNLRKKCGLGGRTEQGAAIGLPRSLYAITIRSESKLVGMGRAVGDLGCHVQITDIAVDPDHQGRGLGRMIMERIMIFVKQECPESCFVNLFADVDFLYEKFGFINSVKSRGMHLDWNKIKAGL